MARLGKVFHNIEESYYEYEFKNLRFIFSSKFYIEKFKGELYNYISEGKNKIKSKYIIEVECEEYLAFSLYKKIEKRGFRVFYKNKLIDKNVNFETIIRA